MSIINGTNGVNGSEYVDYAERSGVAKYDADSSNSDIFASMLSDSLKQLTASAGYTANAGFTGMGLPGGFMPFQMQNQSLEQAIMAASSSGDSNDAMTALLMLMMMMQSGEGGDMSMMMPMMAAMIGNMQDKDALRNSFMMNSGGEPYTLDTMDSLVFNRRIPTVTGTDRAELPLEWWRPATPAITNTMDNRNPALYRAILDQFNVETAERYRPGREGNTYCNIYVWDVTCAMGAELPYYTDPATGAPRAYPDTKGASVNGAIAMDRWLQKYGAMYGWRQVGAAAAQRHANMGRPAVTTSGSDGHVQMIVPSSNGIYDPVKGVAIAQAGRNNYNYRHLSEMYGAARMKNIKYWIHP